MGAGNAAGSGEARSLQEAGDRDSGDDTEVTSLTQTGSAETARSQAEFDCCVHVFLILKSQCNTYQRAQCRDGHAKSWTERTQHAPVFSPLREVALMMGTALLAMATRSSVVHVLGLRPSRASLCHRAPCYTV